MEQQNGIPNGENHDKDHGKKALYIAGAFLAVLIVASAAFFLGRFSAGAGQNRRSAQTGPQESTLEPAKESTDTETVKTADSGTEPDAQKTPSDTQKETGKQAEGQTAEGQKPSETEKQPETAETQSEAVTNDTFEQNTAARNEETQKPSTQDTPTQKPSTQDVPTHSVSVPESGGYDTPYAAHGKLSVKGIQLTDEHGNAFQLRGVSTHGIGWFPQYVNRDTFAELRSWGANAVRLAMYTGEGGYCQTDDTGRKNLEQLIDTGVQAAAELGMYVIIDWHILSDGNPTTYSDMAVEFFGRMSEKYKDYGNVIYEICNEPNGQTSWNDVKSYAEKVIPVIREKSPDAVIIVGTPTWSQDVDVAAQNPVSGYGNLLYTLHFYADTHRENLRNKLSTALNAGLPVIVSEFGICDASGSGANNINEGNTWIETLDGYGISYFIWNLSNKGETSSIIASGNNKLYGFEESELSEAGRWYKGVLTARMDGSVAIGTTVFQGGQYAEQGGSQQGNQGAQQENQGGGQGGQNPQGDGQQPQQPSEQETVRADAGNCTATAEYMNGWQSGDAVFGQYNLTVENTSSDKIGGWTVAITFASEIELSQNWNCNVSVSGKTVTVTPVDYNSTIESGMNRKDIGLIMSGSDLTIESIEVK